MQHHTLRALQLDLPGMKFLGAPINHKVQAHQDCNQEKFGVEPSLMDVGGLDPNYSDARKDRDGGAGVGEPPQ